MTKNVERINSAEHRPKSPTERFEDILEGLESSLGGEQGIGLRYTPILSTSNGDIRFLVYLPSPDSMYSQSITCQTMVEMVASGSKFMAPTSEIHLKLKHLDGSRGPLRDEDIAKTHHKLQGLEQTLGIYKAADLNLSEASSNIC